MPTKKVLLLFLILITATLLPLSAQEKETLAVLDFKTEAVSKTEMSAIVEFLSAELFKTKKYIVIDVSQRETILSEMEFSMSGCSDDTCALEIGKMLSAEMIVTGNLSKVGSRYLLSAKMLETETSRTMGTANGKYGDLDQLIDGLEAIAFGLAGEEEVVKAAVSEPEPEPEAEAEAEAEPEAVEIAEETVTAETADDGGPAQTARDAAEKEKKAKQPGDFNWLAFGVSALGAGELATGGIMHGLGLTDRTNAVDAYADYMSAGNPAAASDLYKIYGDTYSSYEGKQISLYINTGVGGALTITSLFLGDSYISFGGKILSAAGTFAMAAGNVSSVLAANSLFESRSFYEDYMSAGSSAIASDMYTSYLNANERYTWQQYISYGLLAGGALMNVGSWFIPGEKEAAASSLLEKIIAGVGYICLAGGNYTWSVALNARFNADDAYSNYLSAGTPAAASDLYKQYDNYYGTYGAMSIASYSLWGAGAAAVITSLFIPESSAADITVIDNLEIRPSLTGFGFVADISF